MKSKRRFPVLFLSAVLLLLLAGCSGSDPYSSGLEFKKLSEIDSDLVEEYCSESMDGYAVTGYTGGEKTIVVPAQYLGEPVVAIIGAFQGNADVVSVSIPDSVLLIESAFHSCTGLTDAAIPHSVVCIGNKTFAGCTGLTEVTIPDSVKAIGALAFGGCKGLTEATISSGVAEIGECAFSSCTGLTEVTIPDSVTAIKADAFAGCTGLTEVTLPDSEIAIGAGAFRGCTGLTEVTIPGSVTVIGERAFSGCSSLASVTLQNGITQIGIMAFADCALTEVAIPDSLSCYGSAFDDGVVLKSKAYYYLRTLPTDEALAQAEQHLGEELPYERKFTSDQMSAFGGRMTGPFISLDNYWRPDISPSEYNAEALSGRPELVGQDMDNVPKKYLDAMLTAEKTAAVQSGDAEIVYALIECTGYSITRYRGAPNPDLYHEMYRISFRSLKDDGLLGWYQWESGYAPESYRLDRRETVCFVDMNAHQVCLEEDGSMPDPVLDIMEALYGG